MHCAVRWVLMIWWCEESPAILRTGLQSRGRLSVLILLVAGAVSSVQSSCIHTPSARVDLAYQCINSPKQPYGTILVVRLYDLE
jgi:hypothetical protein